MELKDPRATLDPSVRLEVLACRASRELRETLGQRGRRVAMVARDPGERGASLARLATRV